MSIGKKILTKYSRLILLLLIVIVLAFLAPEAFWSWDNISTVIFQQAPFTMLMSFGMTLAIINLVRIMIMYPGQLRVALVVVASMFVTVIIAKCIGCLLPMTAQRLGIDPAIMASPLITTLVDAVSLTVYFELATNFLKVSAWGDRAIRPFIYGCRTIACLHSFTQAGERGGSG